MTETSPSLWGLTPSQLHDRFWAARGVQVVRHGEPSEIVRSAELFLLTDSRSLIYFALEPLVDLLCWTKPELVAVRLRDQRDEGYRERAVTDGRQRFVRFERTYGGSNSRLTRVGLTRDERLARSWQLAEGPRQGWQGLRRLVSPRRRFAVSAAGEVYARSSRQDVAEFTRRLVHLWRRPDATIRRASRANAPGVWADCDATVNPHARFVGPVWIGAGRSVETDLSVVGPSVLWDAPEARPRVEVLHWDRIEPAALAEHARVRQRTSLSLIAKRVFDLAFALAALAATLPVYPLIMLAIWLEDGRPLFFVHRRESLGGEEFGCLKFRSMRNYAERAKAHLAKANAADGPQFYVSDDPRLTRVGRFLRRHNLDELPQFINVLAGHMSVVGPRPSPRAENQFCPAWREARLSVRPGITGLWQVRRTRAPGRDFQEWIQYDIEYVENASWRLDLAILWQTLRVLLRPGG